MKSLSKYSYELLHTNNLCPLDIKIDVDVFKRDIEKYNSYFKRWGDLHHEFPRFAIPIVNQTGNIDDKEDSSCWPLDRWNFCLRYPQFKYKYPTEEAIKLWHEFYDNTVELNNEFVLESDYKIKTDVYEMKSIKPLHIFDRYFYRSCILKWDFMGHFKKHIDSFHPTKWLRLWGTTDSDGMILRYKGKEETNIESGRIYLHDSLKEHEAIAYKDNVHQFFIALDIDSYDLLKQLKI